MQSRFHSHIFWGINSPLTALTGTGLLIIASGRIISALICTLALVWINTFAAAAPGAGRRIFPETGSELVVAFLSAFAGLLFFFIVWLFSPLGAMEHMFIIVLCPAFLLHSRLAARDADCDIPGLIFQAVSEALVPGVLVLGLALIREPLGSGSFSLPGLEFVRFAKEAPVGVLQASSGALIILGYLLALYRYCKRRFTQEERK